MIKPLLIGLCVVIGSMVLALASEPSATADTRKPVVKQRTGDYDGFPSIAESSELEHIASTLRLQREAEERFQKAYQEAMAVANWDGIARCETGQQWDHQTQYDGGLGILHAAWTEFANKVEEEMGIGLPEYGSQATREQQIVVAHRLWKRHGLSGWGCKSWG